MKSLRSKITKIHKKQRLKDLSKDLKSNNKTRTKPPQRWKLKKNATLEREGEGERTGRNLIRFMNEVDENDFYGDGYE